MPELPEVESAVVRLRDAIVGKTIRQITLLHPALQRRISASTLRALRDARIARVDRRGKHQLMVLDDGRVLHAHFRMTGDWIIDRADHELPRHARAAIEFTDGSRVVLADPRMLSTLDVHPANAEIDLGLGPEPTDPALTAESLRAMLSKKRGPIKPTLLDQSVIAGLGNIYAAESLWHSKISPMKSAASLTPAETQSLLTSMRQVIDAATGARYTDDSVADLAVYDREGQPCRRCGTLIERIAQAGRSTYFCPFCQRDDAVQVGVPESRAKRDASKKKASTSSKRAKPATMKAANAAKRSKSAAKKSRAKTGRSTESQTRSAKKVGAHASRAKTSRTSKGKTSRAPRAKRP